MATDLAAVAKSIVTAASHGALGTLAADHPGYPFVSMVPYALDADDNPLLALSALAEHAVNLAADPRASLLAIEDAGSREQVSAGRVTLLGRCLAIDAEARADARDRFLTAHPKAGYVDFADFTLYRFHVEQVRAVAGFGSMGWLDASTYRQGQPA